MVNLLLFSGSVVTVTVVSVTVSLRPGPASAMAKAKEKEEGRKKDESPFPWTGSPGGLTESVEEAEVSRILRLLSPLFSWASAFPALG